MLLTRTPFRFLAVTVLIIAATWVLAAQVICVRGNAASAASTAGEHAVVSVPAASTDGALVAAKRLGACPALTGASAR